MLCGFYSLWWPFDWNWSYLGFLGIIWRMCGSKCRGEGGGIFPTLCVEFSLVSQWKLPYYDSNFTEVCFNWWFLSIGLSHRGRMTHICVSRLNIIGSDNGLSPGRCQVIIWTNAGILLIGPFGTNFSEILIEIFTFSFRKMPLNMSSGKWWPFCLSLNVLNDDQQVICQTNVDIAQCHIYIYICVTQP